ncbi:MAG: ATP-binding cassette domain-containing protein, partial [Firmicutes bacterium]|nr:ATP-binding cassette domain-containing protein [Bacillota bacterium]
RELLAWRRSIGFVPHHPVLFTGTVRENVSLALELRDGRRRRGRRGGTEDETDAVLETVGLTSLAEAPSSSLSSGEAQRVALARALVTRPRVLFLDEPAANLDPANVAIIERSLADAVRSWRPAVVLVTHNLFQARRLAHRAGLIVGGELIELGETSQVFERPGDPRTAAFVRGEMVC